jgi:thymidylate synthase
VRKTNKRWQSKLEELLDDGMTVSPRGKETREQLAGQYRVPMPAYLSLAARKVNIPFLLAEPAWILSGSNRLKDLMPYMRAYQTFSDDGVFLRGAYGPKIVDQLHFIVDSLAEDESSRQAYLNIWRERPQKAADIACTTGMQFVIRGGALHCITTMRSQDIVQGFTFDVFIFSCVAEAVRLLLAERGVHVVLGDLTVTAGSMHLYRDPFGKGDDQFAKARSWVSATTEDSTVERYVTVAFQAKSFDGFISQLWQSANDAKTEIALRARSAG